MSGPRLEVMARRDVPVLVFRRVFQARELYAAAGAERGLAECHERLDELLRTLPSRPQEGQGP